MESNNTNLLPDVRRHALARDYFLRLGVVIVVLVTLLALAATVLLIPTYVLLTDSGRVKEARLSSIDSSLSSSNESTLSARLDALTTSAAVLGALASSTSPSAVTRLVLDVARPGVTLSGFAYTPALAKRPAAFVISGIALSRDSLRSYQLALAGAPFVKSADLPVAAYAKDSNIAFTISMTLAP